MCMQGDKDRATAELVYKIVWRKTFILISLSTIGIDYINNPLNLMKITYSHILCGM